MNLQPYLKLMSEQDASDIYFTTGAPVSVRIDGTMRPVGKSMLTPGMTKKLAYDLLTPAQIQDFEKKSRNEYGDVLYRPRSLSRQYLHAARRSFDGDSLYPF